MQLEWIFAGVTSVSAVVGAIFWWRASRVTIPPFPDVGFDSDSSVFAPVAKALKKGARLNAVAAGWSAFAALTGGADVLMQHLHP